MGQAAGTTVFSDGNKNDSRTDDELDELMVIGDKTSQQVGQVIGSSMAVAVLPRNSRTLARHSHFPRPLIQRESNSHILPH